MRQNKITRYYGPKYTGAGMAGAYLASKAVNYGVNKAANWFKKRRRSSSAVTGSSRNTGVLYGGTFTSKSTYRPKRVSRRKVRSIKRATQRWRTQAAKVQDCQLLNGSGTINTSTFLGRQDYWSLDFLNGNDLRQIFSSQISGTNLQQQRDLRLYIKSFRINFNIVNTGASQIILDIFKVVPRKDIADSEITLSTGYSISNAIKGYNGYYNGTTTVPGTDAVVDPHGDTAFVMTDPGVTPFQSSRFTRFFKIVYCRRVDLPAGQSFTMTMSLYSPRELTGERMQNLSYIKGLSQSILVRQVGMPDGTNGYPIATTFCNWDLSSTTKVLVTKGTSVAKVLTA